MKADLIINTGIQYVTVPLALDDTLLSTVSQNFAERAVEESFEGDVFDLLHPYHLGEHDMYINPDTINPDAYSIYGQLEPSRIRTDGFVEEIPEDEVFRVRGREALDICEGHWIPIPYFRLRQDPREPFHFGPENWCRANLQVFKDPEGVYTHKLVLAFDTTAASSEHGSEYFQPRLSDASDNGNERFKCVLEKKQASKFFTGHVLNDWMFNLYWLPSAKRGNGQQRLRHIAVYHVFLSLLERAGAFPEIGLLRGELTIDASLVLDIGNSRTCGLVCEKSRPYDSSPFDFTLARTLHIRNLSNPSLVCDEPFEMQIAFSDERFGNQASASMGDVFFWPSLVRVGPEAIALTSIFESADSQATMSSPKRYLWDNNPVKVPWIKVDRDGRMGYHHNVDVRRWALFGIAEYMTSEGRVIGEKDRSRFFPATESRYSRSSLMTMAIYEILLHAVSQINDPEFRAVQGNATYRRVLSNVVITCPTAMTLQEQSQLRKSAMDAAFLLKKTMGSRMTLADNISVHPQMPDINEMDSETPPWKFDEATCSQLAYMYGELVHKFVGKHDLFFSLKGKLRQTDTEIPRQSVSIASIDIGGGTTDLMICNYTYDAESDIPFVTPEPLFWEGFNIAGDDIVRRIIEFVFLPELHRHLESHGGKNIGNALNQLFGPNIGGQTALERIYRRQFANQVAAPFAYEALNYIIQNDTRQDSITLIDIFKRYPIPENGLLQYIDNAIRRFTRLDDFCLEHVTFGLNPQLINEGVKDVMGPVLQQLGYLIAQFDCDVILLSGRPSRLPVLRSMLTDSLLFSPDKLICLGDYRFGQWYPFANQSGFVSDPKSTVCVGALVAYLNQSGQLPVMRFDLSRLDGITSTANYIGVMDDRNIKIKSNDVLVGPTKNQGSFKFQGEPIVIGMRQLESEEWIASPLYVFDFLNEEKKAALMRNGFRYPLNITIQRVHGKGEFLSIDDLTVIDADGQQLETRNFEFTLRTSVKNQVHWRDSGSFIPRIDSK